MPPRDDDVPMVVTRQPVEGKPLEIGQDALRRACGYCRNEVVTHVSSKTSEMGLVFAICCFFSGSWLISLLVCCMPGFREYYHYCPNCG